MTMLDEHNCSITYTMTVMNGKWKWVILWLLSRDNVKRYGEIKKDLDHITHKMLSQQLKDLESNLLINRKEYPQIPPKVEYSITEKGKTLIPILELMAQWGDKNHSDKN